MLPNLTSTVDAYPDFLYGSHGGQLVMVPVTGSLGGTMAGGQVMGPVANMLLKAPQPGQVWVTDLGVRYVGKANLSGGYSWQPDGGQQPLLRRGGSISAPLVALTGVTAGSFTIPGGAPTIPVGLVVPGITHFRVSGVVVRTGANATATINLRLGTSGTTADSTTTVVTMTAVDQQNYQFGTIISVQSLTRYFTSMQDGFNATSPSGQDRTANVNFAVPMIFSADLAAANVADSFAIVSLSIEILGG